MLKNPQVRRSVAGVLVVLGALLIFLAPGTWAGGMLMMLGVSVEVVGIVLKRRT